MLITPAGRQFLQDRRIALRDKNHEKYESTKQNQDKTPAVKNGRYRSPDGRERWKIKPESMTQLHGMVLVPKTDSRILLRGKLDSLQAEILLIHSKASSISVELANDLEELLAWAREILQSEVMEKTLERNQLFSLNFDEIRDRSHYPKKHYGVGHIFPEVGMDDLILHLNKLRCKVRETELVGVEAMHGSGHSAEKDILKALNRMSSSVYVLMLRYMAGKYFEGAPC